MGDYNLRSLFDPGQAKKAKPTYHFYDEDLLDKINVAMAIKRPIFITGPAGVGKSSVARGVAVLNEWALLPKTVTSRTEAADLKAEFDAIGRLSDASVQTETLKKEHYVSPGVLWKAFNPEDAKKFLDNHGGRTDPQLNEAGIDRGRVLLIDEIDKGDLDFANDLLDVFDEGKFYAPVVGNKIERAPGKKFLIVITSNGERDFSDAFKRRCIRYEMKLPPRTKAGKIGEAHLNRRDNHPRLLSKKTRLDDLAKIATLDKTSKVNQLNVSQYIDLIDAVLEFEPMAKDWADFIKVMQHFYDQK